MKKILVYGFYFNHNLGDDLFQEAFCFLFPNYQFVFTDIIDEDKLQEVDAVFFGGGSFLLGTPVINDTALNQLMELPIFYLGVGIEAEINPLHQLLMKKAKLIATRSADQIERLNLLNDNVCYIPDLVYALQSQVQRKQKKEKSVLIIPNINVVPTNSSPYWQHAAWSYFKSEFTQFLDWLIENNYNINFFSMGNSLKQDDKWAMAELLSSMTNRNNEYLNNNSCSSFKEVSSLFSQYDCVITQRFHGIILSEITRTPYIAIHHHDKLKFTQPNEGIFLSYYNLSKNMLILEFNRSLQINFTNSLPILSNTFEAFSSKVSELVDGTLCRSKTQ